jgi:DNA-binding transcriptional regulator YiaG
MSNGEYVCACIVLNKEVVYTSSMKTPITEATMSPEDFAAALQALGWKQSDFCRKSGVTKQTPSRWANGQTPVPAWVPAYLGAMLEIKRLHQVFVEP